MQNWKKGRVFCHIDKFWNGHDRQIKKNACKNAYLGSIFIPEKYVIRLLFVSPWTSLIPPLAIRVPPGFHLIVENALQIVKLSSTATLSFTMFDIQSFFFTVQTHRCTGGGGVLELFWVGMCCPGF